MNNRYPSFRAAYQAALKLLTIKDRTRKEIYEKLCRKGFEPEVIKAVIEQLEQENLINDHRFGEVYFNELWMHSNAGPGKIMVKSRLKGLNAENVEAILNSLSEEDQIEKIKKIICRKLKTGDEREKLRIYRYLLSQGFSFKHIKHAFREAGDYLTNQQE